MKHEKCPICGYDEMPYAPVPENICPCCGTQYGFDDYYHTPKELRLMWIEAGFPWFDDIIGPPENWSPVKQLLKAGCGAELLNPTGARIGYQQQDVWDVRRLSWRTEESKNVDTTKGIGYAEIAGVPAV